MGLSATDDRGALGVEKAGGPALIGGYAISACQRKDEGRWFAMGYLLSPASRSPSASISAIERRGRNIVQPR